MICVLTDFQSDAVLSLPTENFCLESAIFNVGQSRATEITTTTKRCLLFPHVAKLQRWLENIWVEGGISHRLSCLKRAEPFK